MLRERPGMTSHAATHICNFAETGQRSTAADERCFLHRTSLADVDMEEVKPTMGIRIRLCVHNYGAAETIKRCEDAWHSESTTWENCDGRTIPFRERFRSADESSRRFGVVPLVLRNIQKRRQILFSR